MKGTKADALDRWAGDHGRSCIRFDYSGHGESGGDFADGTIGRWLEESVAVFERFAKGPQVLVGSSMGGWLALLLVRALKARKTARLRRRPRADRAGGRFHRRADVEEFFSRGEAAIETEGSWQRPSQYSESAYPITRGLIDDGRKHLLLGGMIETGCPVRILQGVQDPDVPWQHAVELSSRLARDDVVLTW